MIEKSFEARDVKKQLINQSIENEREVYCGQKYEKQSNN